jgi:hypothetical protein
MLSTCGGRHIKDGVLKFEQLLGNIFLLTNYFSVYQIV